MQTAFERALLEAAETRLASLEGRAAELLLREAEERREAGRTKRPLGDGYWKPRHEAEGRARLARAVRDAIVEAVGEITR